MSTVIAYLGLGSNLGDRRDNLVAALDALHRWPGIEIDRVSSVYETAPVECSQEQRDYLNAVVRIETSLTSEVLLTCTQQIERDLGRRASVRNAPRTIDLDMLLYAELCSNDDALTLPHPRMQSRVFVLQPLAEIAPELIHPVLGQSIADMLASFEDVVGVRRIDRPDWWRPGMDIARPSQR